MREGARPYDRVAGSLTPYRGWEVTARFPCVKCRRGVTTDANQSRASLHKHPHARAILSVRPCPCNPDCSTNVRRGAEVDSLGRKTRTAGYILPTEVDHRETATRQSIGDNTAFRHRRRRASQSHLYGRCASRSRGTGRFVAVLLVFCRVTLRVQLVLFAPCTSLLSSAGVYSHASR